MGAAAYRRGSRAISRSIEDEYRQKHPPKRQHFFTIKRTTSRRYPLHLLAAHEDRGPYLLVDLAGFGSAWRSPDDKRSWRSAFQRALLAFTLTEMDENVDAKVAKKIADKVWAKLGPKASPAEVERYAFRLLDKGAQRDPTPVYILEIDRGWAWEQVGRAHATKAAALRMATERGLRSSQGDIWRVRKYESRNVR